MSEHIIHVTDGDFEDKVLNADGPVLVDFCCRPLCIPFMSRQSWTK